MPKCPRCGHGIPNDAQEGEYPGALSRRDNKTYICSECGTLEALEDFMSQTGNSASFKYRGPVYWEINERAECIEKMPLVKMAPIVETE